MRSSLPSTKRGFTLVELLVVVAMVGILSVLAVVGYRKWVASAGTAEATAIIQHIRYGETVYKTDALVYLGCSANLTAYYPMAIPDDKKYTWEQAGHPDYDCWRQLNVRTDGAVRFGYAVMAGSAADPVVQPVGFTNLGALQQPTEPWYVIQAAGDRDGDGIKALVVATSWSNEIYMENETE